MRPINRFRLRVASVLALLLGFTSPVAFAETTFTFQGRLGSAGMPANGSHDFEFRLFDAESGGTQVSGDLTREDVAVTDGIFTVQLDFGTSPYDSSPRWLDVDVREAGGGAFTTLDTRFRIGTAPFAIEALAIAPGAVDTAALQDGAVTSVKIAPQAVTRSRIKLDAIGTQQIENNTVTSVDIRDGAVTNAELGTDAVTRDKIADHAVGTFEIENNTITSADIRDGSIAGVDITNGGGLLHRKAELQRLEGSTVTINGGSSDAAFASCGDENDIAISFECDVISKFHSVVIRETKTNNWTSDAAEASVTCAYRNNSSLVRADVRAAIYCLSVP